MAKRHYTDRSVVLVAANLVLCTLNLLRLTEGMADRIFLSIVCLVMLTNLALDYHNTEMGK